MTVSDAGPKKKVAILGGGPAGLSAAYALSATPELRARFDVTVYQSGWRVGGKCGQGRRGPANQIEINGTHYLFGAYDAAFKLARDIFAALADAGDSRFGSFESQFLECRTIAMKEFFNGNWETWVLELPGNGKPPGTPSTLPSIGDTIRTVSEWIIDRGSRDEVAPLLSQTTPVATTPTPEPHWWSRAADAIGRELGRLEHHVGLDVLRLARDLADKIDSELDTPIVRDAIVWLLRHFRSWAQSLLAGPSKRSIDARRMWQLVDIGTTVLIGMIEDDVLAPGGFEKIDQYDLREWLTKWGAEDATTWSAPITTWYNAIAAYADGNIDTPNMSAGMGLRGMLRLGLTYKGAFSFQLSYEVGDSIVAPLYQVLVNRGVKFMYFHRVRDVVPSADGNAIDSIVVEQQATMLNGDPASYQPFITLPNARPVWPDTPNASQLQEPPIAVSDSLSFYAPQMGANITLKSGVDFDVAVYAIPVAAARWTCSKLMTQKSQWASMVDGLGTTETQSLRLWLYPSVEEMGWTYGQAVLSGYYQPLATWEDAAQLVAAETWPKDKTPKGIATIFGAFPGAPLVYPGPDDTGYPARRAALANQNALNFCRMLVGPLWPNATHPSNPVGIDWSHLVSLDAGVKGAALLETQSIRANVGPIEAYTQIHKGTLQFRLRADESGYSNLALAGDWIRNGYEIGSVEGAILGGEQAAEAVMKIVGG